MAFIRQRTKTDCGIAALAMLCDVTYEEAMKVIPWRRRGVLGGTYTRQLREGAFRLGYWTKSTPQDRLKVVQEPVEWVDLLTPNWTDYWYLIPNNSLVKIKNSNSRWHWVVWRNNNIYDPFRGVFHPSKHGAKPLSYMQFMKKETVHV